MNVFDQLREKLDISSEREEFSVIHNTVSGGIEFKGTNLWVLIFAIFIASVGLNVNSTAVIIGAMLVSPLMGPILGMGYGIATYDFDLFKKAIFNYLFALLAGLLTSAAYFYITPIYQAHSELLARTQPNIYDVIIALMGGLAGIVAISSKSKGNVIPGVAIATALMPPLCTAGYGLATANWQFFFGALYLLTINTVFIGSATLITVRLLRYPIRQPADETQKRSANRWVSFIAVVTTIPALYYGYLLVQRENFVQSANDFIANESFIEGDFLLKQEIDHAHRRIKLIYGGKPIAQAEKDKLNQQKGIYGLAKAEIVVQQGFSVSDVPEKLSQDELYKAEIARLKSQLALSIQHQDSISKSEAQGGTLLTEIRPLFPEITYCSAEKQVFSRGPVTAGRYMVVVLGSDAPARTGRSLPRIASWLKARFKSDSVKVFVERSLK